MKFQGNRQDGMLGFGLYGVWSMVFEQDLISPLGVHFSLADATIQPGTAKQCKVSPEGGTVECYVVYDDGLVLQNMNI